jgi:hypothetical protein
MIEGTMRKALVRFGTQANTSAENIEIWISPNADNSDVIYNRTINRKFERDEEGNKITLDFTNDILGNKFDLLQRHLIVSDFITKFFTRIATSNEEFEATNLSANIGCSDDKAKQLRIGLFHKLKFVKWIKLEDITNGL